MVLTVEMLTHLSSIYRETVIFLSRICFKSSVITLGEIVNVHDDFSHYFSGFYEHRRFLFGGWLFFWYLIVCHVLNLFLSFMYFVFQIKKIILVNRLEATVKHVCVRWRLLAWQQV